LGLVAGLSGALIPGPLLVYTLSESLRKGFIGPIIMLGHVAVEIGIIALLLAGLNIAISSTLAQRLVGVVGGIAFLAAGIYLIYLAKKGVTAPSTKPAIRYGPFIGGIIFTAFNPSFPIWWGTIGCATVFEALNVAGVVGVVFLILGHWVSDVSWYSFVSYSTDKAREFLDSTKYRAITGILGATMMAFGPYLFIKYGMAPFP